jgi:signal transduction histidine kinase
MILWRSKDWSLAVKLPVIVCLVVVGVASVIGGGVVSKQRLELHEALSDQALLLAKWVAGGVAEPLLRNDVWSAYRILRQVAVEGAGPQGHLLTAMVLDPEGNVVAHLHPGDNPVGLPLPVRDHREAESLTLALAARTPAVMQDPLGEFVEAAVPVFSATKRLGVVRVRLSTEQLSKATAEATQVVLALAFGLALAGSLVGIWLSLRAVRPLHDLADAMARLGNDDPGPWRRDKGDEIARLGEAFRRMASEVAEKQQLERDLAQSEKAAALGRIAAGVAHEVNNPLAGILNCISTIKDHPEQPGLVDRYLPVIERGLLRIRGIVQDLLVEQRAENADEIDGGACLDEVRELIMAEAEGRGIALNWDNQVPNEVRFNRPRLQQALLNLCRNAMQAMPDGGRLRFQAVAGDGQLRVEIEDTGVGIAAENLPRLFDPFFSLTTGGTGLGLWITLRLIQSMSGIIEVRSEPGQGSTFRIEIPVAEEIVGPSQQ